MCVQTKSSLLDIFVESSTTQLFFIWTNLPLLPFTCLLAVVVMFGMDHGWPWLMKALIMLP
jgi:hypothetical protein